MKPVEEVKNTLTLMAPQFKAALPKHISIEKFMRVAQTAILSNPDLMSADRHSLYGAITRCAQEGLLPDGRESAIVIFNKNVGSKDNPKWIKAAQNMPMISGILKLVRNSGEVGAITVECVYKNDKFRYWIDADGAHLEHEPDFFGDRGEKIGAYSLVKFKDDTISMEVMRMSDIEKVKNSSKSSKSGPWVDWADEMWKKTVLRRHSKRLPRSTDLDTVIRSDDELFDSEIQTQQEVVVPEITKKSKTKPNKLNEAISKKHEEEIIPEEMILIEAQSESTAESPL